VTGAGPIGLLAALAAKMFGLDVHVLDQMESGTKPDLVRALGAIYHSGSVRNIGLVPDAIMNAQGWPGDLRSIQAIGSSGTVCLTGVGHGASSRRMPLPMLRPLRFCKNNVIVGSVNANKRHWFKPEICWLAPTGRG